MSTLNNRKQTYISHSSAQKHAVNGSKRFATHEEDQMCPPAKRTGFVRVDERNRKTGNGGYVQVSYGVAATETKSDTNAGVSSYNDYILYNYGSESERYHTSDPGKES